LQCCSGSKEQEDQCKGNDTFHGKEVKTVKIGNYLIQEKPLLLLKINKTHILLMKNLILILLAGMLLASCAGNKDQFTMKGSITGVDSGMIFLQKYDQGEWVKLDSVKVVKGLFEFKGAVVQPEMWYVSMQEKQVFVPVFVENAEIGLQIFIDSLDKSKVQGSATHDIYNKYVALNETINKKMEEVYREWKVAKEAGDTAAMARADSASDLLDKEMKAQLVDFVKSNTSTVVAPYLITRNAWQFELAELEELNGVLDTALVSSIYAQAVQKRVDVLRTVQIGQPAPEFTMNDSTGQPVALSSLKGKVLLVDFWASWCSPCRAENPNVVKAWQAYNKKGFDVLGVSFDSNREKWIKAVKDDNLTWTQVSDLKGWANEAGKLYGVNSIPANVLLDADQKIIGRNLRGEDLLKKLEELFGPAPMAKKTGKKQA
jgi:peroxiredoxin